MSENKMGELAKLLGVELEEEFIIKTDKLICKCKLTKDGIYTLSECDNKYTLLDVNVCKLITGEYKIIKLPWKAELYERYYIPNPLWTNKYGEVTNNDLRTDNEWYKKGLMCQTKRQAIEIAEAMIKVAREMQGIDKNE